MNVPERADRYENGVKLDFSETLNYLGLPKSVRDALGSDEDIWQKYADPACSELRRKIGIYEGIDPGFIVCGTGGDDMIYRVIRAVRPRKAIVYSPVSGECTRMLLQSGCNVTEVQLSPHNNFSLTSDAAEFIDGETDLVYLSTPNNPTGGLVSPFTLGIIADRCKDMKAVLVCDERFMAFVHKEEKHSAKRVMFDDLVIIKSFDKTYAMAGLRLGYAICGSSELAAKVAETGQRICISRAAQKAGEAAIDDVNFLSRSRTFVMIERQWLTEELTKMGVPVFPSQANFIMFSGDPSMDRQLMKHGIRIKSCEELGLPEGYFRAAVRSRDENEQLVQAVYKILHS